MRRTLEVSVAIAIVGVLVGLAPGAAALVDDFEDDFWLPFTHFHLGDRASADYSSAFSRSGAQSYHVAIWGWTVRDFGSAYGYALFATDGAPITELRLSLLYERLQDVIASPWDAYAAGVSLDLLDVGYHSIGRFRYITAYQASRSAGRCAPTTSDLVLPPPSLLGAWTEIGRNPATDFPSAGWPSAAFVKISVGFLCASGLTGASYSLYFDDFLLDTGSGDSDEDGLSDLEEEMRVYTAQIKSASVPVEIRPGDATSMDVMTPPSAGLLASAAIELEIDHARLQDLSVSLDLSDGLDSGGQLLWDPGFRARGAAILAPHEREAIRGAVEVRGRAWRPNPLVQFHVDDAWIAGVEGGSDGGFSIPWNTDAWPEGPHTLFVIAQAHEGGEFVARFSREITIVVDRTPPDLELRHPLAGDTVSGLAVIEAQAFDGQGVEAVELWIDGSLVEARHAEPYAFAYDTMDLSNDVHTFEVRARDAAGNEATRATSVRVDNKASAPPPPCFPACNLDGGAATGNLPPLSVVPVSRVVPLASGDLVEISEGFRAPWRPQVVYTDSGVAMVIDLMRPRSTPESDGLVGPSLTASDLVGIRNWRVVIRDYGDGLPGTVLSLSIRLALRTAAGMPDTDGDGIADGAERSVTGTSPVLSDFDADLLSDGEEFEAREIHLTVDGNGFDRIVRTDPFDFDSDDDGLPDGLELRPGEGANLTDPLDPDTDHDFLPDGPERFTYGSDPTLTDTDGDTLSDYLEVTPRDLALEIDGVAVVRSIVTSPRLADTDGDGLRDDEEWAGESLYGFLTDPTDPDTDRDGLSDFDEVIGLNRRPTNPVQFDTEGDGIGDGLDLSPTELWALPWRTTFELGMVRFTQRFHALGVHGIFAGIWTYDVLDDECVFLSDHTASATRGSDESPSNVLGTINQVLVDGGETNFTALSASDFGQESWGTAEFVYGACDFWTPRQYRIQYIHDSHGFDVDFVNDDEVEIPDEAGDLFYHASLDIPIRLSMDQTVIVQVSVRPEGDRGGETPAGATVVPAFVYSLVRGTDFLTTLPFYRNLAIGAAIDDHAYEFQLRIPANVAREENVVEMNGQTTATLVVMPIWLTSGGPAPSKAALNAADLTVGAVITRIEESADLIVARLNIDMAELAAVLPKSTSGLTTGFQSFGAYSVYVYRIGDAFNREAPTSADAIYFLGNTSVEIASFQETVSWNPKDAWFRESHDGFGLTIGIFKILRRGISLTSQITAAMLVPLVHTPTGTMERMSFGRSVFVSTKLEDVKTGLPYYVIGENAVDTVKIRVPHPEVPSVTLTEVRTTERELRGEVVDDLDDSRLLTGAKYSSLKSALRGAAVGATLVIFGSQAVLAFRDGDVVRGSVYVLAGATGVFGVIKADSVLVEGLFEGRLLGTGLKIKLGTAAAIAVGAILASYELFLASETTNPITRLSHYESAGAVIVDTLIAVVPLYGTAAMLGWQLGLLVVVGAQALLGAVPDALALKIVSSPGSAIVFLFEYVFASDIPSGVAEDALISLLNFLVDGARYNNSLDPPLPTLVLVP